MIGTTAALIGMGVSAAANIGGAALSASASKKAAETQTKATQEASELQYKASQEALAEQKRQFDISQANLEPWKETGVGAMAQMKDLVAPGGEFSKGYPGFSFSPTDMESIDPGYQFRLAEGQKAIERAAAAGGKLVSGATMKAMTRYSQNYAGSEYQPAYERALSTYQTNLAKTQQERSQKFGELATMAGYGTGAVSQGNQLGSSYAANVGNIQTGTAASMADLLTQGANAQAAGQIGSANAWGNALSSLSRLPGEYMAMARGSSYGGGSTGSRSLMEGLLAPESLRSMSGNW